MGMGFAPTWLRQVSPLLHMTTLTTASWYLLLSVYTVRSSDRPGRSDWSVRPVGPTGRTNCGRTAHICQSNQCGLL